MMKFISILISIILTISTVLPFNLDLNSKIIHSFEDQQWFGYSVALHVVNGSGWILVGAPKAKSIGFGEKNSGTVYRCSPEISNACQEITIDYSGRRDTNDQWFGTKIFSSADEVVACATRFINQPEDYGKKKISSSCYTSNRFQRFREQFSCRSYTRSSKDYFYCMTGLSVAKYKNDKVLSLRDAKMWRDSTVMGNMYEAVNYRVFEVDPGYIGYSTTRGSFSGDDHGDIAVGYPGNEKSLGQIMVLNSSFSNLYNITEEKIGSLFGYSVTSADINGDSLEDIIVGAPLYSDEPSSYLAGRVYIFYQTKDHKFHNWDHLDGMKSKGMFGLSVSTLGSINNDRWEDLCVGAPYDGNLGRGVVYLFLGGINGIASKPTQVIQAEDISPQISTFGFSLSGGQDLDSNGYNDLVIGCHESDSAIYLRSRPIVKLEMTIYLGAGYIDLDSKRCSLSDVSLVPCILLSVCFKYSGHALNYNMKMNYKMVLDANRVGESRLFFLTPETESKMERPVKLQIDNFLCHSYYVYIPDDVPDQISPIIVKTSAEIAMDENNFEDGKIYPILDKSEPNYVETKIPIKSKLNEAKITQLAHFGVFGVSTPENVSIEEDRSGSFQQASSNDDIGPEVTHTYIISNPSGTIIQNIDVDILWPIKSSSNDPLLYLTSQPLLTGNGFCRRISFVNENNSTVKSEKFRKSHHEKILSKDAVKKWMDRDLKNYSKRSINNGKEKQLKLQTCGRALCMKMKCHIRYLAKNAITISISGRLSTQTLKKLQIGKVIITSSIKATMKSNVQKSANTTVTTVVHFKVQKSWTWVIILAVCSGTLIFIGVMVLSWKIGLFKKPNKEVSKRRNYDDSIGYQTPEDDEAFS